MWLEAMTCMIGGPDLCDWMLSLICLGVMAYVVRCYDLYNYVVGGMKNCLVAQPCHTYNNRTIIT